MPESKWSLPTPDGKTIYGVLNVSAAKKNKKAILHIHGLTGDPYGFAQTLMAQQFPDQGYDVIRPYLYHAKNDARKLVDCTMAIHAQDIDTLTAHFKNEYEELFIATHSYGGPSALTADINQFKAACLWDPTYDQTTVFTKDGELPQIGEYRILVSGTYRLMGEQMYQERMLYGPEYSRQIAAKCTIPLQVILAADGWGTYGETFTDFAGGPKNQIIIPDTAHCFYEEGTIEPLLKYTKKWFDKYATV